MRQRRALSCVVWCSGVKLSEALPSMVGYALVVLGADW